MSNVQTLQEPSRITYDDVLMLTSLDTDVLGLDGSAVGSAPVAITLALFRTQDNPISHTSKVCGYEHGHTLEECTERVSCLDP